MTNYRALKHITVFCLVLKNQIKPIQTHPSTPRMAQVLEIASLKFEYFLVYLYWDQKVFMFYKHMNMFAQNKSKTAAMTNIIVKVHTKFPLHF